MGSLQDRRALGRVFGKRKMSRVILRRIRIFVINRRVQEPVKTPIVKRIQSAVPTTDTGALAEKAKT